MHLEQATAGHCNSKNDAVTIWQTGVCLFSWLLSLLRSALCFVFIRTAKQTPSYLYVDARHVCVDPALLFSHFRVPWASCCGAIVSFFFLFLFSSFRTVHNVYWLLVAYPQLFAQLTFGSFLLQLLAASCQLKQVRSACAAVRYRDYIADMFVSDLGLPSCKSLLR